ncbi:potassium-transporting ATPase subunit KdpA [Nonomuraea sp. LPB2021202275-12-8]|uniref:potassium-transporting ATPase subunit KdpA n=1 Tax=Nonomuraea sp. LPB2021202275-12-8 TaxID=3120159 RepID=UPI00300D7E51
MRQEPVAATAGPLRTQGINFVTLATGAALILALLKFLPALSLGSPGWWTRRTRTPS